MCDAWLCQNALIFHGPKIITSMHPMAGTIDHIAAEQRRWQTLLHLIHQGNHPQNPKNITYCKLRVFFSCFDPNSESLGTTEKHGFHGILELFSIMKSTMDFFPKQFTVGVLNATLDLAALVLVGVVGFLGSEVVLSPVVSGCLP